MFKIGPPSSTSGSEPPSRDVSPSKCSEWSTISDHETDPKTPQKRANSVSPSEAYWSDDSDTPVRPRASRREGHFYDSPDERSFLGSDAGSFLASDERSLLSPSDSRSDSGSGSESEEFVHVRPEGTGESESENELPIEFANPEEWEPQHDPRLIDPLMLGEVEVPVRPLPPIAIHETIKPTREAWGLPPLKLRCPIANRRHPNHIYQWNTKKLNCYDKHEPDCQLCGSSCCSVQAYTKAINEEPRPNPLVPFKYREAFQRDIDEVNALKPAATDPFERMLRCDTCHRNVCPDCAGRCMQPDCLRIICVSCGGPDPWYHCQCAVMDGKVKISYI